jgi:hypothetical protein
VIARARGWLAAAVAVLLIAGFTALGRTPSTVSGHAGPAATPVAERPAPPSTELAQPAGKPASQEVQELLDRRAAAIRQRDETAFMATLDPYADPAFLDAQRAMFVNLHEVPLTAWGYHVDGTVLAQPPPRRRGVTVYAPRTVLRYALRNVDAIPTERPLGYLYIRRDGRWYLASDNELGSDAPRTWRGPWDFGPCVVLTTPNGMVLGHPGHEELIKVLAAELDGAVHAVTQVWGDGWSRRAAVLLPASLPEMRELVGPAFPMDGVAAAAIADRVDLDAHTAVGQRVVFNPTQAATLSPIARRIMLRHELTHVATRAWSVDGAPMWLLEGFADYVGYRGSELTPGEVAPDLARAARVGELPDRLPTDAEFRDASGRLDVAYQLAWSMALHVAERAGEAGLMRLYREVAGNRQLGPSTVDTIVDGAVRQVLGTDLAGLVASWQEWLPSRFG